MEENKNTPVVPPVKAEPKTAPAASEVQQKQKQKNKLVMYIAYTVAAIIVLLLLMKFFGKGGDRLSGGANTELPDPADESGRLNSKKDTYDLDPSGGSSFDGGRNLDDIFATAINKADPRSDEAVDIPDHDPYAVLDEAVASTQQSVEAFTQSIQEQRQKALAEDSSTREPSDREKELEAELHAMKTRMEAKAQADAVVQSLLDESERIGNEITAGKESEHARRVEEKEARDEAARVSVSPLAGSGEEGVVSSLTGHRCASFYGMGGAVVNRNTIAASVYGQQVVMSGQQVRLRLEEPMVVGTQVLLPGSILTGTGTVGLDRLYITVSSIEYNQVLTPVSLEAYDIDGQRGIFVPGSLEQEALREFGRELAGSLASTSEQSVSSFVNSQTTADRLKSDLARGVIQGISRFAEKKLDQIRITLQADHKLLLFPNH